MVMWFERFRGPLLAASAIVIALALASCTASSAGSATPGATSNSTSSSASSDRLTRYTVLGYGVGFDYPARWHVRPSLPNPSGNETLVFVGSQDLPNECQDDASGGVCYPWPIMRLSSDGIVFAFRFHGIPGSVARQGGAATSVGGRPATRITSAADGGCGVIGGDESIRVVIEANAGEPGWYGVDACLAGPDHAAGEAALADFLASVTWSTP